jgi:hypothetical protein
MAAVESAVQENEERDRQDMKNRLEIWDDDESDELFYVDRFVFVYLCIPGLTLCLVPSGDESDSASSPESSQTMRTQEIWHVRKRREPSENPRCSSSGRWRKCVPPKRNKNVPVC